MVISRLGHIIKVLASTSSAVGNQKPSRKPENLETMYQQTQAIRDGSPFDRCVGQHMYYLTPYKVV